MSKQRLEPDLSPEERMQEVASILAQGFLRFRRCTPHAGPKIDPEISPPGLDFPSETRLSVASEPRVNDAEKRREV